MSCARTSHKSSLTPTISPHNQSQRAGRPATATTRLAAAPGVAEKAAASQVATPEPLKLPTNEKSPNLLRIRHTSAHVMAMAVQRLFPGVQVTIGPWIDNGFYYDFDTGDTKFTEEDLSKIKKVQGVGLFSGSSTPPHSYIHTD